MFGIDSLQDLVRKAKDCARVCLIVYAIMSMFDIDSSRNCAHVCLIVYEIESMLTLIAQEIVPMFCIKSLRDCVWH